MLSLFVFAWFYNHYPFVGLGLVSPGPMGPGPYRWGWIRPNLAWRNQTNPKPVCFADCNFKWLRCRFHRCDCDGALFLENHLARTWDTFCYKHILITSPAAVVPRSRAHSAPVSTQVQPNTTCNNSTMHFREAALQDIPITLATSLSLHTCGDLFC